MQLRSVGTVMMALNADVAAAAAGIPADQNGNAYYASCPSAKGTVWRIEEGA
ncbi:MAG TPA: hypothetical protein VD973_23325 [Symbiobacteriaceae bacterium]|nr:hypothetical protein [Symbiobacteriaceae bacterium]